MKFKRRINVADEALENEVVHLDTRSKNLKKLLLTGKQRTERIIRIEDPLALKKSLL